MLLPVADSSEYMDRPVKGQKLGSIPDSASYTCSMTLGKSLSFSELDFLISKMGMIIFA